jgi:hypothetical protein
MDKKTAEEFQKKWSKVIAKAWIDEDFKQKLLKNPQMALKEAGLSIPGMTFEVHENSEKKTHLILPQKPTKELSEEQLKVVSGGETYSVTLYCCSC